MDQCKVVITDIDTEALETTKNLILEAGGTAVAHPLDVSDKTAVDALITKVATEEGGLDYCINNAGIGGAIAPLHDVKLDDWERTIQTNLSSVFYCLQAQIKVLLVTGGGSIVNVASMAGLKGMLAVSPYVASKHGVIGLTKTAANEYAAYNIRVNAVCPGWIETDITKDAPKESLDYILKRIPMKRIGQPEEVANTITWLLSPAASFITGNVVSIDGGTYIG